MPNRILRDWTDSEKVNGLTTQAERFFVRLIMKVDDFGRFSGNIKLIKSMLFPLLDDIRDADITRWMAECQKAGLILVYLVNLKPYIQIENFNQRLRQKVEKYPGPEASENDDGQMTVNGQSDDGLKRSRNEVEVETRVKGKIFHPPEFQEFLNYFLENEFPHELALRAFNHYVAGQWHDTNGNPVKNWKQKVQSVWFKKEKNGSAKSRSANDEAKIGRIPVSEADKFMQTRTGIAE